MQPNIRYDNYYTRDIKKGKEKGKNFLPGDLQKPVS